MKDLNDNFRTSIGVSLTRTTRRCQRVNQDKFVARVQLSMQSHLKVNMQIFHQMKAIKSH